MKFRSTLAVAAIVVAALSVSGCTAGSRPTPDAPSGASPYAPVVVKPGFDTSGGNVNVLMSADFMTLDPGNSNYVQTANVGQLYYRTLTMAKETSGQSPEIVPDLATDTGTVSADGLTWSFTLKKGLLFEDGSPITSKDVKYGIARTYARDVFTQAPQELNAVLDSDTYKGPYASNAEFTAVETPNAQTVIFHLKRPFSEFAALVSRSNTAPVPADKDTKLDYTNHPISSGPYMIDSYDRGRKLILVRNPHWDPTTDENRTALPDTFTFSLSTAQATISQQLLSDADPTAITLETNGAMQASDTTRLNEASVAERTASGLLGCIDTINFNTEKIADPEVRHAIALAMDRAAMQLQYGGLRFGQITNSTLNPKMVGYVTQQSDLNIDGSPQIEKAKALLKGKDVPAKLSYGYSNATDRYKNVGTVLQQNLAQLGIELELRPIPAANYYTVLASAEMPDIARAGWCGGADSNSVRTTADPNLGTSLDGSTFGFSNIPRYYDSEISPKMYALRSANGSSKDLGMRWATLYNEAMQTYPLVPLIRTYTNSVVGSQVRNAQVGYFFGAIDLSTVGVAQ